MQGGNNYHLKYNRLLGRMLVEASYSKHNGDVSDFAVVPGPRNTIVFRETDLRTLQDEQLGGFGLDSSYFWDNGFQIGGNWRWNSGTLASRTFRAFGRNLPLRVESGDEFEFAGVARRWLSPSGSQARGGSSRSLESTELTIAGASAYGSIGPGFWAVLRSTCAGTGGW